MVQDHNYTHQNYTVCDSDIDGQPFLEPSPMWAEAHATWGFAWDVHINVLGAFFTGLALIGLIQTLIATFKPHVRSRCLYMAMNMLIMITGLSKAINFFVDPYNSKCLLPRPLGFLLLHITTPCITSTFGLLLVMLLKLSRLKGVGRHLIKPGVVIAFVVFNMTFGITADMLTGFLVTTPIILVICLSYFLLLGIIVSIAYFYAFGIMYRNTVQNRKNINKMQRQEAERNNRRPSVDIMLDTSMPLAVKVALAVAIFFFLLCLVNLFYLIAMLINSTILLRDAGNGKFYFKPWFWLIYQSVLRVADLILCGLIAFCIGLPLYSCNRCGNGASV